MKNWTAIVAMASNRVIGREGKMPWHLPEDLRWFKEKTLGGALLMGRKTYESIGRPLPGRVTYVISRTATFPGTQTIRDLATYDFEKIERPIFVVGGGEIYRELLPRCAEVLVTQLHSEETGDAWMPEFEEEFPVVEVVREAEQFRIVRYARGNA